MFFLLEIPIVQQFLLLFLFSKFYKIICWYDNEAGYSNKLIDLAIHSNG